MALKHTKVSGIADGADATLVQPSDWNAEHVVDANGLAFTSGTGASTPSSGKGAAFAQSLAGVPAPAWITPDGRSYVLGALPGQRHVLWWRPLPGSASTTGAVFGGSAPNTLGTATARTPAFTGQFAAAWRTGFVSATTTGSRGAAYFTNNPIWRGNAARLGGFRVVFRFGISDASFISSSALFVGLAATSGPMATGVEPDASVNIVGVGANSTDTNLAIYSNDGTGTATRTTLGASFPANTTNTDMYELVLYAAPNDSQIGWQVTRLNTGDTASGSLTSDLPVNTQSIFPFFGRCNMANASAVGIDVMGLYVETEV